MAFVALSREMGYSKLVFKSILIVIVLRVHEFFSFREEITDYLAQRKSKTEEHRKPPTLLDTISSLSRP